MHWTIQVVLSNENYNVVERCTFYTHDTVSLDVPHKTNAFYKRAKPLDYLDL